MGPFARVAVLRPLQRTFHYTVPERLRSWVRVGVRCLVPFGRARVVAFVLSLDDAAEARGLKAVSEVLDPEPLLPPDLLALGLWLSRYYHHPLGETLAALLPPSIHPAADPVYRPCGAADASEARDSPRGALWSRLCDEREVTASSLSASDFLFLDQLAGEGRVERDWRVRPSRGGLQEEWFAPAADAPSPDMLPARFVQQIRLLRALAAGSSSAGSLLAMGVSRGCLTQSLARGWVERVEGPSDLGLGARGPTPAEGAVGADLPFLTQEQESALRAVTAGLDGREFRTYLLQGVTGSGKTEVYLRAAEAARRKGLGSIVLVPEISLTPQLLGRFERHFGPELALLHSAMGDADRRTQWERLRRGEATVAIGARSAVFAPIQRLGLVVVDEEHDTSYKQEEGLRYNAKHVALVRAREARGLAVLGSATPDLETRWAATSGRYERLVLSRRVSGAILPEVRIVDLRQEEARRRSRVVISQPLRDAVQTALGRGEQALLFLNRRGFSPALLCPACGKAVGCSRCSIALTLHRREGGARLVCHYCDAQRVPPEVCPSCGSGGLFPTGIGTQRVVESAAEAWPGVRVVRLDRDTARRSEGAAVLALFHKGEGDVLVGTQMIAKGHHFSRLTVVGVVDADLSLAFPDFRAAERTFQILTQVAGRAGREERPGLAFVQTRNPFHPIFAAVAAADYESFAASELDARRDAGFPPFRRLSLLRVSSPSGSEARDFAQTVATLARRLGQRAGVDVFGPAPAPLERVRGRYRFQILLKAPDARPGPLQKVLGSILAHRTAQPGRGVRLHADVDPVSML